MRSSGRFARCDRGGVSFALSLSPRERCDRSGYLRHRAQDGHLGNLWVGLTCARGGISRVGDSSVLLHTTKG